MNKIGVAISTTGDEHRLGLLVHSVAHWSRHTPHDASLFVTVDGDDDTVAEVAQAVEEWTGSVYQVGGPLPMTIPPRMMYRDGRLGVAVNKNTGLELLMDSGCDHLFLSDDDTWPLSPHALALHTDLDSPHSMVNWGRHRIKNNIWTWPRGAMLYAARSAVEQVGGLVEAFGPGGHEHVEWSRRIHQHGLTATMYPTPKAYEEVGMMGAARFWHAEDMQRRGEPRASAISRRRSLTSVRRLPGDWEHINQIMIDRDGDTTFVPYQAKANGRSSATLYQN